MQTVTASAPGKVILFGEHAVVYGRPAIAVPVQQVQAKVEITANPAGKAGTVRLQAPAVGLDSLVTELPADQPLVYALQLLLAHLKRSQLPACTIRVTSTIPVAAGLGSGAAVTVALLRAVAAFLHTPLPDEVLSCLAFQVEKIHHGTPSGIDNTVVTWGKAVYFIKGQSPQSFAVGAPFTLVIGDTGIPSPTSRMVAEVRSRWQAQPQRYEAIFDEIGSISQQARQWIENGAPEKLGSLMLRNHELLKSLLVSSPELERLVQAALQAGAWGAKLSGAGGGGNMIALVTAPQADAVAQAICAQEGARAITTRVA